MLDDKYESLPEVSLDLMCKATFMDLHYQGDYNPNAEESKRMIEEEVVIIRQAAQPEKREMKSRGQLPPSCSKKEK